jgi:hypothetical protein
MANNRMYLVHRSGKGIYLGKRMADGWYDAPENLGMKLQALFDVTEFEDNTDDFMLVMERANKGSYIINSNKASTDGHSRSDILLDFDIDNSIPHSENNGIL